MLLGHYYYYFQSALSEKFCNEIVEYGKKHTLNPALTFIDDTDPNSGLDFKINQNQLTKDEKKFVEFKRKSNIAWLDDVWIYKEIRPFIEEANHKANWNFDWDWTEPAQFTKYDVGQHYGWHADGHHKPYEGKSRGVNELGKIRKLSVTVSLTDPSEYDGGNLEFSFRNNKDYDTNPGSAIHSCLEIRPKGSIVVFPSFVWHRVTPVTRGTRYSLVLWNLGYPFR
tara:strand:+ start:2116 stop:2790 length:675 start_codon:yes stop_codon:yes gene_type:complete